MLQVVDVFDGVVRQTHQDVLLLQPGLLGGPIGIDVRDPNPTVLLKVVVAVDAAVDGPGLTGDAEVGADHTAVSNQHRDDALGGVAGHGKTDALGHGDDRGVDAHLLTAGIVYLSTG